MTDRELNYKTAHSLTLEKVYCFTKCSEEQATLKLPNGCFQPLDTCDSLKTSDPVLPSIELSEDATFWWDLKIKGVDLLVPSFVIGDDMREAIERGNRDSIDDNINWKRVLDALYAHGIDIIMPYKWSPLQFIKIAAYDEGEWGDSFDYHVAIKGIGVADEKDSIEIKYFNNKWDIGEDMPIFILNKEAVSLEYKNGGGGETHFVKYNKYKVDSADKHFLHIPLGTKSIDIYSESSTDSIMRFSKDENYYGEIWYKPIMQEHYRRKLTRKEWLDI